MNILVVNGSPRGAAGNTEVLVQAFLVGATSAGAQAEVVYLKDKKINHCIGCFNCWTRTPGVCIHKDDMPELLEKVKIADTIVYACPLYIYTVPGLMKDFMDRILPMAQPFINVEDGLSSHPRRYAGPKSIVLISNSGFPEQAHFSGLKETVRCWVRGGDRTIAGMICCAGGALLRTPDLEDGLTWYTDAVREAGRQVVVDGQISDDIQATLDKPLMADQKLFAEMANAYWRSIGIKPIEEEAAAFVPELHSGVPMPAPTSMGTVGDLIAGMAAVFDPVAAGDLQAVVQFVVTDGEQGRYYVVIGEGKCTAYAGDYPSPTMTVTTPAGVWLGIARGEISGTTAFMTGQYKVTGDMSLLMRFEKLFPAG